MTESILFARKATGLVRGISGIGALVNNLNLAAWSWFIGVLFISGLLPGFDIRIAFLLIVPLWIPIALLYPLLSATIPRAGGDYVWVTRILHPAVGFTSSFVVLIAFLGGAIAPWPTIALQWGAASIFQGLGILNNDPNLTNIANQVSSPLAAQIFGLICFAVLGLVIVRGVGVTFRVQLGVFLFLALSGIVYIVTVLSGIGTFQQRFDSMSGTSVAAVVSSAVSQGYGSGLTTGRLLAGLAFAFLTLNGFYWSGWFAGEIKEVRRSQLLAIVGGLIISALITLAMFSVTYYGMGREFIGAISYLFVTGSSSYNLPLVAPFPHFLLPYVSDSPLPVILVGVAFVTVILAGTLASMFIVTRIIFAWSFDRVIGGRLSAVDQRYNSPYLALILTVGLCMIFQAIYVYTTFLTYISYFVAAGFGTVAITGLAGAVLPYRRKDLFELAPAMAQRKIGGIPLITLVGTLTLAVCAAIVYAFLSPALAGPFYYIPAVALLLTYLLGAAIYFASSAYHKKRNPLEAVFREIPPE